MVKKEKLAAGAGENIRVCVRVRPLSQKEKDSGCIEAVQLDIGNCSILVHHAVGDPTGPFTFDAVYNNSFKQRDIFNHEVYPMVECVLQGYNSTVFAYGQSGSGKTYTMTGTPGTENAGVMPNAIAHIFDSIAKLASPSKQFQVKVSHLELYNGKARDLLSDSAANLEIKQNMAKNFYVKGLIEEPVSNLDQTLHLFDSSLERRRTACTDLNEHSSRSHSIFTISVESLDFEADPTTPQHMVSKLNLVDLAGSERQSKTGAAGDTLKEGCNINLSLSALGTVIDTLVKGKGHVPYRSSPLTMLLKDSLGGNSKTVMFANVGPADRNVSETISTLRFADRAKQITNKPVKNLDPKDLRIQELQAEVERLQKRLGSSGNADFEEIESLKVKIEQLEVELTNAYASMEKDKLSLDEEVNVLRKEVNTLRAQLQRKEAEIGALLEEKQMWGQTRATGEEHTLELKRLIVNFVKGALSATDLKKVLEQKSLPDSILADITSLDSQHIVSLFEGLCEHFIAVRKNAISGGDMEKFLKGQAAEFEKKFASYKSQQEMEKNQLQEAKKVLEQKLELGSKEVAESKVRVQQMQQELDKAAKKFEKQLRKMEEKMEKAVQDQQAQLEQSEKSGVEQKTVLAAEVKDLQQQLREAKKLNKEMVEKSEKELKMLQAQFEQERLRWQSKQQSCDVDLQQSKTRIEELEALLKKFAGEKGGKLRDSKFRKPGQFTEGEENSHQRLINDTMIMDDEDVDPEVLHQMQRALQVQFQLSQIRQQQQLHFETLVQQHRSHLELAAEKEEAKSTQAMEEMASLLEVKEREIEELKERNLKDQEKLLKKVNKKLQEFSQKEAQFEEERNALEEERHDLLLANEELNKVNEQLEMEIQNLKIRMEDHAAAYQRVQKDHEEEITAMRQELEETQTELSEAQKIIVGEFEEVKDERDRLLEAAERLEVSLKEKMVTIENNRQTMKWTATVLEREKRKIEELNEEIENLKQKMIEMERHWQQQMAENANKLVAINNRKMQEQILVHQQAIEEEHKEQKALKEKLKKAKNTVQKEKQKYDELVLEYDQLQRQFEEFKVTSMRMYRDRGELEIEDSSSSIRAMIQSQNQERQAKNMQFEMGGYGKRK
eukprot:EG_transcript_1337